MKGDARSLSYIVDALYYDILLPIDILSLSEYLSVKSVENLIPSLEEKSHRSYENLCTLFLEIFKILMVNGICLFYQLNGIWGLDVCMNVYFPLTRSYLQNISHSKYLQ